LLVDYETPYSLYDMNDYKRCVCNEWGDGLPDCQSSPPYYENWSVHKNVILSSYQSTQQYELPLATDPDGDSITVSVDLTNISEFSTFNPITNIITFNLEDTDTQPGSYTAEIKLYDERDSSYYTLFIEVIE